MGGGGGSTRRLATPDSIPEEPFGSLGLVGNTSDRRESRSASPENRKIATDSPAPQVLTPLLEVASQRSSQKSIEACFEDDHDRSFSQILRPRWQLTMFPIIGTAAAQYVFYVIG